MPGSLTAPGRNRPRGFATVRIAFRPWNAVGARDDKSFAAQWLAYASPCRRFAADLAVDSARLAAGAVRETFTVEDFHLMLLAGLPAHSKGISKEIKGKSKTSAAQEPHEPAPVKNGLRWPHFGVGRGQSAGRALRKRVSPTELHNHSGHNPAGSSAAISAADNPIKSWAPIS